MTIIKDDEIKKVIELLSQDYEIYENTTLNGTVVDYLFLNKSKGAIFLNITTDKFDQRSNKRLDVCLDNLYLPEKYKRFLCALILEIQNNEYCLYKKIYQNYFDCYSNNSNNLALTLKYNLDLPIATNSQDEQRIEAQNLYNCIKSYISVTDNNEDFFINLSKEQMAVVTDDLKRIRVTGAAGSGKTLVVALKAARHLALGQSVLITSFNITMMNYIRALINRALSHSEKIGISKVEKNALSNLVTIHYHGLLSKFKKEKSIDISILDDEFTKKLIQIFDENPLSEEQKKDLIIIDEGQDFKADWLKLLSGFLRKNGTLVLAADAKQDIYDKSCYLTGDLFKGLGFRGPWRKLKTTYRLPSAVAELSRKFAENFLLGDNAKLEFGILPSINGRDNSLLFGCNVKWYQCNYPDTMSKDSLLAHEKILLTKCKEEVLKLCSQDNLHLDDICVLCNCKSFGRELVQKLNNDNIPTESIFAKDYSANRIEKLAMGSKPGYLKCSTIHSFKGWESYSVILINVYPRKDYEKENLLSNKGFLRTETKNFRQVDHSLFYVGLTRVNENMYGKSNLIIINEVSDYQNFAKTICNADKLGDYKEVTLKENVQAKVIFHAPKIQFHNKEE